MSTPQRRIIGALAVLALGTLFYALCGIYTIQPIGALPEGKTLLVWRQSGSPFFDSPDGTCLRRTGSVSILCRLIALKAAPVDHIIMRFAYSRWAYMQSTDGATFDR